MTLRLPADTCVNHNRVPVNHNFAGHLALKSTHYSLKHKQPCTHHFPVGLAWNELRFACPWDLVIPDADNSLGSPPPPMDRNQVHCLLPMNLAI